MVVAIFQGKKDIVSLVDWWTFDLGFFLRRLSVSRRKHG